MVEEDITPPDVDTRPSADVVSLPLTLMSQHWPDWADPQIGLDEVSAFTANSLMPNVNFMYQMSSEARTSYLGSVLISTHSYF